MLLSPAYSRSFFTTTHKLEIVRRCFTLVFPSFLQKYSGHVEHHCQPEARKCWRCLRSDLCFVLPVSSCHITSDHIEPLDVLRLCSWFHSNDWMKHRPNISLIAFVPCCFFFFAHSLFFLLFLTAVPIPDCSCYLPVCFTYQPACEPLFFPKKKKEAGNSSRSYHKDSHLSVLTV